MMKHIAWTAGTKKWR